METIEQAVAETAKKLGARLLMKGLRLATAESCTGGWIAKLLTDIAGSSDWFDCAIVSYSNAAKKHFLKVPDGVLLDHGAVSENTVIAMQQGLFLETSADAGISISGIAGPGGGSEDKPVGMVWIAVGLRNQMVHTRKYQFQGDRNAVRLQAVAAALKDLLDLLESG
ncbi:MAG: CinA family protein [Gammaproteobacteria bacterium]|nr:CinA family protein [Gammaproteobacteria bacterium]